jgi:hypothetical protein
VLPSITGLVKLKIKAAELEAIKKIDLLNKNLYQTKYLISSLYVIVPKAAINPAQKGLTK